MFCQEKMKMCRFFAKNAVFCDIWGGFLYRRGVILKSGCDTQRYLTQPMVSERFS